jgi:hypothetical protein
VGSQQRPQRLEDFWSYESQMCADYALDALQIGNARIASGITDRVGKRVLLSVELSRRSKMRARTPLRGDVLSLIPDVLLRGASHSTPKSDCNVDS